MTKGRKPLTKKPTLLLAQRRATVHSASGKHTKQAMRKGSLPAKKHR